MGLHTANQRNDWECGVQKKNKKTVCILGNNTV